MTALVGNNNSIKEELIDIRKNKILSEYFHSMIFSKEAEYALEYIRDRGISDNTIKDFQIGWCPPEWNGSMKWKWPRRLMFPLINAHSDYVSFHTRIITKNISDSIGNKYVLEQETNRIIREYHGDGKKTENDIVWHHGSFDKSLFLYGLNKTKDFIVEKNYVVLVEGIFDALILYENGIKNVVATLGTAFTDHQICSLLRYCDLVIFMWDSDDGGKKALKKSMERSFLKYESLSLPEGFDPHEFVINYGIQPIFEGINKIMS